MRALPLLLSVGCWLALAVPVRAHGGSYPPPGTGPGDPVYRLPGAVPTPASPGASKGTGATRPGTGAPSGPQVPGPAGPPTSPSTGGLGPPVDISAWHYWWHFNKDPLLQVRKRIAAQDPSTSGAEFFLGRGQGDGTPLQLEPTRADVRELVVPALAKALKEERSDSIVSAALIALARIGDDPLEAGVGLSPMAELIRGELTAASQEIQETAALALGILEGERNVFLLAQLVEGDARALRELGVDYRGAVPERTRAFAAHALGLIGHAASVPARAEIVRVLAQRLDAEGRQGARTDLAVACITGLGLTPLPWRPSGATRADPAKAPSPASLHSREEQVAWLLALCDDAQVADLASGHLPVAVGRLLADAENDHPLRARAIERLVHDLDPLVHVPNARVRGSALALGLLADADADAVDVAARRALQGAVEEAGDRQTRFFALLSLAQVSSRPGRGDGDPLAALAGEGNTRAFLLEKLARGRSGLRPWAAVALGLMEHDLRELGRPVAPESQAAVLDLLAGEQGIDDLGALAIAAGLLGGPDAAKGLRAALERTADPEVLVHVATALGMTGRREDLEPLLDLVRSARYQPLLMEGAAVGAALIGGHQVAEVLVEMLQASSSYGSQAAICKGLGFLADRRSIPPLLALLGDPQKPDLARSIAAVALGLVADKQDLPWGSAVAVQSNYTADVPTFYEPSGSSGLLNLY